MTDETVKAFIISVIRQAKIAISEDDKIWPITHFYDKWGDECRCDDAISCVAGDDTMGWIALNLLMFEKTVLH